MIDIAWVTVKGFKGLYEVSNTGLIKSFKRSGAKGSILKPGDRRGYKSVTLCKGNIKKPLNVHRVVAKAFLLKPKGCNVVNHKDGNKLNNNIENLEWTTKRKNIDHAINILGKDNKGEKNGNSKLTEREVKFLRWIKEKFPILKASEVSKFYQMSDVNICDIWNRKKWKNI